MPPGSQAPYPTPILSTPGRLCHLFIVLLFHAPCGDTGPAGVQYRASTQVGKRSRIQQVSTSGQRSYSQPHPRCTPSHWAGLLSPEVAPATSCCAGQINNVGVPSTLQAQTTSRGLEAKHPHVPYQAAAASPVCPSFLR